jgi:hypothetical protein
MRESDSVPPAISLDEIYELMEWVTHSARRVERPQAGSEQPPEQALSAQDPQP